MLPQLSRSNFPNEVSRYPKLSRYVAGQTTRCAYLLNLFLCQLGSTVIDSAFVMASALLLPIIGVVLIGSQEKMIRSNTRRIIARVQDQHSFRNSAEMYDPRRAMRVSRTSLYPKSAVSLTGGASSPRPTLLRYGHLCPESLAHASVVCQLRASHRNLSCRSVVRGAVAPGRAAASRGLAAAALAGN